jgi:signal transduction histidine kinase
MESDDCKVMDSECHLNRIENWHSKFESDISLMIKTLKRLKANSIEATDECSRHYMNTIELTKAKSSFTFEVSHELKAPLASVYNIINVILDGYLDGDIDKQKEYLNRAKLRIKSVIDLLNDLLVFSRLEERANEIVKKEFNAGELFSSIIEEMNEYAKNCSVEVDWNLCSDCPILYGNKELIRRVFTNLIHNAVKYSKHSNRVKVMGKKEKDYFLFRVEDHGIGIEEEEMQKIFDIFYRGENTERDYKNEGIGLGLSLVKRIVDVHRGSIKVKSKLHEGTTVEVRFTEYMREDK